MPSVGWVASAGSWVGAGVWPESGCGTGWACTGTGFCGIFGTTAPFDTAELTTLYPTHAAFTKQWNKAVDDAVAAGFVMKADAQHVKHAAEQSTVGTGT